MPHLLAFSGSLRQASFNQQLVTLAAKQAEALGASVKLVSLNDYNLPLFNEDIEKDGLPQGAQQLKADMIAADGYLIASPEYNAFFTPALKNAIDWASRPNGDEPRLACFAGKVAGLLSASPGALGGLRGIPRLHVLLQGIGTLVVPQTASIGSIHEVLPKAGEVPSADLLGKVTPVVQAVINACGK